MGVGSFLVGLEWLVSLFRILVLVSRTLEKLIFNGQDLNDALLVKQLWRFPCEPYFLWHRGITSMVPMVFK